MTNTVSLTPSKREKREKQEVFFFILNWLQGTLPIFFFFLPALNPAVPNVGGKLKSNVSEDAGATMLSSPANRRGAQRVISL